jgi:diguanylate cyclase (GGDEF)-like protein
MMNEQVQAKLDALKKTYTEKLPGKINDIEQHWLRLSAAFDTQKMRDFHVEVHSLAGSAGTYGYTALGHACRDLDIYLQQLLDCKQLKAVQKNEIAHLIEAINISYDKKNLEEENEQSCPVVAGKVIFYLCSKQEPFHAELQEHLKHLAYDLILFTTYSRLQKKLNQQFPAAIVLDDVDLDNDSIAGLMQTRPQQIPLLCLASNDDLYTRLKAIRVGVSFFIQKPVEIFYLTHQLVQVCDLAIREDYRILILDDSEPLASYYSLILEEAGMNVRAIHSPHQLMHELQDFKPNLLLLDLYLPECDGFDIAKIIRQEESYMSLPIIFISSENDRIKQLSILNSCGADDFLTKPVLPQNLISAVKSRAQRSALLNTYIALDSLTKLLNHTYFLKQLTFELLRAQRFNQPVALAMIDLDYFKHINDNYGHPVGDLVLKKMAELFLTRVRKTDFVGRYGGEEFAIIFPNTTQKTALHLCTELCEKIAEQPFHISGNTFYVTLSIGIAHYPSFQTAENLVAAADCALYRAKSNGRNQVKSESK